MIVTWYRYGMVAMALLTFTAPLFAQFKSAQYNNAYGTQYGISAKAQLEIDNRAKRPNPIFRFTINGGIGSSFAASWLYPSFNVEVQLYNGGLGSKKRIEDLTKPAWDVDFITAFTLTGGVRNHFRSPREVSFERRNIPLYYFADFVYPALQNPYDWSLSIGTNLIFPTNPKKKSQRVGFINGHFYPVQISYYNDGGVPIYDTYLGDRRDRYYTGGAVISYHGKPYTALSLVEVAYHKFTGYTRNAFEVSNKLFLNYVNYYDAEQKFFNKSLVSVNIGNPYKGYGLKLSSYNDVRWDVQHFIHWGLFNAYHMVPYKSSWSVSGIYYNTNSKTGIQ